ncbi:MAG TPA: tripartite tricarboxylate transporter substrate-binding protein [Phycisphaerae bacterium]|nr:tripartite tricarboxylate transporter substrate-binding protein [Phycisphaerae bacterium]
MATRIQRTHTGAGLVFFLASALLVTPAGAQENFYKGKQINLVVGYGTGGGYDVYARLVGKHISRFIPGNPNVVVQNMPGAGSLRAVNHIYNVAPKDGTAFAMFSSSMPVRSILGGNKSVQFDSLKMTWLGSSSSFAGDAYLLVVRTDAPSSTIEQVRRTDGQLLVIGSSGPGSSSYDIPAVLRDTIGLRYKMVSGYPGSADLFLAMERNETQARMVNLTGLKAVKADWLKPGSPYRVLVQFGRKTRVEDLPDVPTARELALNASARDLINLVEIPFELSRPFAAPPNIPADRAKILQAAFRETHRDPQFLAEAKNLDLDISPVGPDEVLTALKSIEKADPKHLEYLRKLYAGAKD